MAAMRLPKLLTSYFNRKIGDLYSPGGAPVDFSSPKGEAAIYPPESLSWRVYKNPVCTFIGGISSVYMQLSEPRVRAGVWGHSNFKNNAALRFKRTGAAAMMRIYGPHSEAKKVIERVNRMHESVSGVTSCGKPYSAKDPVLLGWVFNTATYGGLSAYDRFGAGVSSQDMDDEYSLISKLRGGLSSNCDVIRSSDEMDAYFANILPTLEGHDVLDEFTEIMNSTPLVSKAMLPFQRLLVRASVSNVPDQIREKVGLDDKYGLRPGEEALVKMIGRLADSVVFDAYPAVQACKRVGLPDDFLYRSPVNDNAASVDFEPLHDHNVSIDVAPK